MYPYFAYGTTQQGFPHHRELYDLLGEPVGRFRTVEPYAIVVPHAAACSNPGCRFVHRMAALVRGDWDVHAEGDVFLVSDEALAALDRLELSGPYTRETSRSASTPRRRIPRASRTAGPSWCGAEEPTRSPPTRASSRR